VILTSQVDTVYVNWGGILNNPVTGRYGAGSREQVSGGQAMIFLIRSHGGGEREGRDG
jgi:hypothetical protein